MKVAVAQIPMAWTADENTTTILDHLARAKSLSADLVLFPECAITGYHRRVPEVAAPAVVEASLARIRAGCAALELPAMLGTPRFSEDGATVVNSAVAIGADGEVLALCEKSGLTASERRYFAPGRVRQRFSIGDVPCCAIFCREVRDLGDLRQELEGTGVVFWPSMIHFDLDGDHPDHVDVEMAQAFARTVGCWLVQCNWPASLNRPDLPGAGASLVISPGGEVVHRLPRDRSALDLVSLTID